MARPVIGIIGNAHLINDEYPVQAVGVSNIEAVADLTGAIPLVVPALPIVGAICRFDRGLRRIRVHRRAAEHPPEPLRRTSRPRSMGFSTRTATR